MKEKLKLLYSACKAFAKRNFFALLIGLLIILQPVIWFAMRSLEDTLHFYRCGSYDYPCGVTIQPEPKP